MQKENTERKKSQDWKGLTDSKRDSKILSRNIEFFLIQMKKWISHQEIDALQAIEIKHVHQANTKKCYGQKIQRACQDCENDKPK